MNGMIIVSSISYATKNSVIYVQFDNYVSHIDNQNNIDQDERGPQRAMDHSVQRYFLLVWSWYLVVELI